MCVVWDTKVALSKGISTLPEGPPNFGETYFFGHMSTDMCPKTVL